MNLTRDKPDGESRSSRFPDVADRYLFSNLPENIPSAKVMDTLKNDVPKLAEHHLFVTEKNFAVFGESTNRGAITQNCYESIRATGIELPECRALRHRPYFEQA